MSGIIVTTFNEHFFMNWFGTQPEEGYEFFLLAIGMSASLVITGAGSVSIDQLIARRLHHLPAKTRENHRLAA
jgi:putative oxidoreductase